MKPGRAQYRIRVSNGALTRARLLERSQAELWQQQVAAAYPVCGTTIEYRKVNGSWHGIK